MALDIDLKHLRYVLAVVDEGTFTGAAERLQMSQPALSRAIRAVEDEIGTALFVRRAWGAEPTEAGRMLSHDARHLVESLQATLTHVSRTGHDGPRLRVTARACDVDVLHRLVDTYHAAHPHAVTAHTALVDPQAQADQLRSGDVEVTLLRTPYDDRDLDTELLLTDQRVAILPAAHPLAARDVIHRSELAGAAFPVWPDRTPAETAYWSGTDLEHHEWHPGPVVHDAAQYLGCVQLGHAVGFLIRSHLPERLPDRIRVVPVLGLSASELRIAWPARATSPDVARFVRHATDPTRAEQVAAPLAAR